MLEYRTYSDSDHIDRRLAELGLVRGILLDSARQGVYESTFATKHHPATHAGYVAWSSSVKALSDHLVPSGWIREDPENLPLVIHPSGRVSIMVSSGNAATGREEAPPQSKHAKGSMVAKLVRRNAYQLELTTLERRPEHNPLGGTLWILLLYRDDRKNQLRLELSRPSSLGRDLRINGWSERVILPAIDFDDDTLVNVDSQNPSTPDTSVEVSRKRG